MQYTSAIGRVAKVNGNLADVQVEGLPILLSLPILCIKVGSDQMEHNIVSGDNVVISFIDGNLNKGVVMGVISSNVKAWKDVAYLKRYGGTCECS